MTAALQTASSPTFDRWVIDAEGLDAIPRMQSVMTQTMLPYTVSRQPIDRVGRPPCVMRRVQFGALSLLECDVPDLFSGHTCISDTAHADRLLVTLTTAGRQIVEQDGRHASLGPGDIFVVDGALPGTCHIPERINSCTLIIPKLLVPSHGPLPDKLPAHSPTARLLGDYMLLLARELADLPTSAVDAAERAAVELAQIATTCDQRPLDALPVRVALLPRVRRYIEGELADADLDPQKIAAANAISVRTLHAMFADTGESVGQHIRRRRLERALGELVARPDSSVIDISRRCGFKNASHFARVFKAEYGTAPNELRNRRVASVTPRRRPTGARADA